MENTNFSDLIKEYTELTIELANEISSTEREKILLKTAKNLPDNPADSGMKASAVKPYFYSFATDTDNSLLAFINRAVRTTNEVLKGIKDKANTEFSDNNLRVNDLVNRLVTFNANVINECNSLQSQINTIAGNVGSVSIGDLASRLIAIENLDLSTRLIKVENLLTSDNINLDTLQEIVDVLENSTEEIEGIFIQLATKVSKEEGKSLVNNDLIDYVEEEFNKSANLYDNYNTQISHNVSITSVDSNSVVITTVGNWARTINNIDVKPYTDYTFSAYIENGNKSCLYIDELGINSTKIVGRGLTTLTFNSGSHTRLGFQLYSYLDERYSSSFSTTYSNIMLNEGSTALPYQPYNASKHITNYEANFLKEESLKSANLFDFDNDIEVSATPTNGTATIDYVNKTITMNADTGDNYFHFVEMKQLKPNTTYTFSVNCTSEYELFVYVDSYISGGRNNPVTFTTNSTGIVEVLRIDNDNSVGNDTIFSNIMLNEGSTALPYQEYRGEILHRGDWFKNAEKEQSIYISSETNAYLKLQDGLYVFTFSSAILGGSFNATIFLAIINQNGMSTVFTNMGGTNAEIRCLAYANGIIRAVRAYGNDTWTVADDFNGNFTYRRIG